MENKIITIGRIERVTGPKEYKGKLQLSILQKTKWYNIEGDKETLEEAKKILLVGCEAELTTENGIIKNMNILVKAPVQAPKSKEVNKSWTDDMTNYGDLLNAAHDKVTKDNLFLSMESKPVKNAEGNPLVNFETKQALYEATLTIRDKEGKVVQRFVDTGDAEGISNVLIKPHFNRMASTRAMARCYRIYTNNSKVSEEEVTHD